MIGDSQALSWSADGTLRLWDLQDGSSKLFKGHTKGVSGVHLIGDSQALSWSEDGTLRLWDLQDGSSKIFNVDKGYPRGVCLIDDNCVFTWSSENILRQWNLKDGLSKVYDVPISDIKEYDKALESFDGVINTDFIINSMHPISEDEALTCSNSEFQLWNFREDTCKTFPVPHTQPLTELIIVDNIKVLTSSWDNTLCLTNLTDGSSTLFEGHSDDVYGFHLIGENQVLSWSGDFTLRLWDLDQGLLKPQIDYRLLKALASGSWIDRVLLTDNNKVLCCSFDQKVLFLIDLDNFSASTVLSGHHSDIDGVYLIDGNQALSWSYDTILLWDLKEATSEVYEFFGCSISNLILVNKHQILFCSNSCEIIFRDLINGATQVFKSKYKKISRLHLVVEDQLLFGLEDGTICLWNWKNNSKKIFKGHTKEVSGVHLIGEDQFLTWSKKPSYKKVSWDNYLILWNVKTGSSILLEGHTKSVKGVHLIDDNQALSWSDDGTLRLWNLVSGTSLVFANPNHDYNNEISGIFVLKKDQVLIWSKGNPVFHIINLRNASFQFFEGHTRGIKKIHLFEDNKALTWCYRRWDLTIRLWDLKDGSCRIFEGHSDYVLGLLVLDRNKFVTWSLDGSLILWDKNTGIVTKYINEGIEEVFLTNEKYKLLCFNSSGTPKIIELF